MKHISSRSAFTLVELLVVIAIIGILAGMGFAGYNRALNTARRAVAKNDVTQIANAVLLFETEYGKLPPGGTTEPDDVGSDLMRVLTATEESGESDTIFNPRRIVFLEVNPSATKRSGTNEDGKFIDPWGNAYQIVMDTEYEHRVNVPSNRSGDTMELRRRVAVWSQTNEDNNTIVTSWE